MFLHRDGITFSFINRNTSPPTDCTVKKRDQTELKFSTAKERSFGLTVSQQAVKGWALSKNLETIETHMIKHTESRGRGTGDSVQTSFTCAEQVLVSGVYEVGQVFAYIRAPGVVSSCNPGVRGDLSKVQRKGRRMFGGYLSIKSGQKS